MMINELSVFLISSTVFILTPGLDTVFVINKALTHKRKAGIIAAIGIGVGVLFHTLLAAVGISLIIASSSIAFTTLKYFGAIYLCILGYKTMRDTTGIELNVHSKESVAQVSLMKIFTTATLTNVLNPKVALFFIAFFPQFVDQSAPTSVAFIKLGSLYAVMSIVWLTIVTYIVSIFSDAIISNKKAQRWINTVSGIAFIGLGIRLLF